MQIQLIHEGFKYVYGIDEFPNPEMQEHIDVSCAQNDWAAFQLFVRADQKATLSLNNTPAFSKFGAYPNYRVTVDCAAQVAVKVQEVGLIPDDSGRETSDLLLNHDYICLEKDKGQPVWIELTTTAQTPAGTYNGAVKVYEHFQFSDETLLKTLPFTLTVKNYAMPDVSDYDFHLDLWQHNANIARKHEVSLYSDAHFAILEDYVKSLAELGQKAVSVIASEIPWSGQTCFAVNNYPSDLYEYNMIAITKKDGVFHYDYSAMKRYIELCFRYGIDREIEVFGLVNIWIPQGEQGFGFPCPQYPDAVRLRYLDQDSGTYRYMQSADEIRAYITALQDFFVTSGWLPQVLIVADEPGDTEKYERSINEIRAAAPLFRFKVAINHAVFIEQFADVITDMVPALNFTAQNLALLQKQAQKGKGRILNYVCCGPDYPNTFVHSPAAESLVLCMVTYYMGFDGFLRWNYTVWPENPRERISYRAPGWKAGDTNFVYPGNDGKPILSVRYKYLKRGIEDFELLKAAAKAGKTEAVAHVFDSLFHTKDLTDFSVTTYGAPKVKAASELYSVEYPAYQQARNELLDALSK